MHVRIAVSVLIAVTLCFAAIPVPAVAAGESGSQDWSRYKTGDRVEVSPACSQNYMPATIASVGQDSRGNALVTVAYPSGQTFNVVLPGNRFAPCVRRAGAGNAPGQRPAMAVTPNRDWSKFVRGSRIEVSPACSSSYSPATIVSVAPSDFGAHYKRYHVRYESGEEFDQEVPSIRAVCVRAAGGNARDRAALSRPPIASYQCNYRGTVQPMFDFTLLDGTTYRDYDGKRGTYRYDSVTKRIAFVSGPKSGTSFQQVGAKSFNVPEANGSMSGTYCVGG